MVTGISLLVDVIALLSAIFYAVAVLLRAEPVITPGFAVALMRVVFPTIFPRTAATNIKKIRS